jgi:hypothetical protein
MLTVSSERTPVYLGKLSRLQKQILLKILQIVRQPQEYGDDFSEIGRYRRVPVLYLREQRHPKSRGDSAAFSRAVRRLESRGLVLRINRARGDATGRIRKSASEPAPRRADCLVLTKLGEEVAKRLHESGARKP